MKRESESEWVSYWQGEGEQGEEERKGQQKMTNSTGRTKNRKTGKERRKSGRGRKREKKEQTDNC